MEEVRNYRIVDYMSKEDLVKLEEFGQRTDMTLARFGNSVHLFLGHNCISRAFMDRKNFDEVYFVLDNFRKSIDTETYGRTFAQLMKFKKQYDTEKIEELLGEAMESIEGLERRESA